MQHETIALQYEVRRPSMLASILVTTVALISLQVVLVIKLADWLSEDSGPVEGRNAVVLGSANGRFSGIV